MIAKKGYTDEELPATETIATKLNSLGYFPKKVAKDIRGTLFGATLAMKARQVIFHQLFYSFLPSWLFNNNNFAMLAKKYHAPASNRNMRREGRRRLRQQSQRRPKRLRRKWPN